MTLWVKRRDVAEAQYVAVKRVDTQLTVVEFKRRWLAQAKLDTEPGLVNLRLVKRGPDHLTKVPVERLELEEAATTLDPEDTLEEAGVADGSWLVAEFASRRPSGSCLY